MDINDLNKAATQLAKENKYDQAIELLKEAVLKMKSAGGYGNNGYTKIIPYFQKARRYSEAIEYAYENLIPALREDCRKTFPHKPAEIRNALFEVGCHQIFDKLRLNAKREKLKGDEIKFEELSRQHLAEHKRLRKIGEDKDFLIEYRKIRQLYGDDSATWPPPIYKRFGEHHGNM